VFLYQLGSSDRGRNMLDSQEVLSAAITLARQALDMLDSIDASHPAVHLQYAIDVMTNAPVPAVRGVVCACWGRTLVHLNR